MAANGGACQPLKTSLVFAAGATLTVRATAAEQEGRLLKVGMKTEDEAAVGQVDPRDGATNLRVEYLTAPLSIDTLRPRFSFVATCGAPCLRGTRIASVKITVVALATRTKFWSALLNISRTSQIEYAGAPLLSNADYVWTVSWSRSTAQQSSSTPVKSTFSTALFDDSDWQNARWLGAADQRLLRRPLDIPQNCKVVRARAFVAAPGCHALQIDSGAGYVPVGDQYGICPWTDFGKTVLYQTYDMTSLISSGNNTLQLFLGNGMWLHPGGLQTGAPAPVVRFVLTVTLDDGTKLVVRSDDQWIATRGPYVANDPWSGTTTDCALLFSELPTKEYFGPAEPAASAPVDATLRSLMMPLSRHMRTLLPVKATLLANTNIRFDFAENFVGVTMLDPVVLAAAFRLPSTTATDSAQRGDQRPLANFTAQHCERYHNASSPTPGSVDCLSAGANAKNNNLLFWQTDQYWNVAYTSPKTTDGPLNPRFTWHGFQYVEVSVTGGDATAASVAQLDLSIAVKGIELRTDIETVGALAFARRGEEAGDYILNRIQTIVTNSQKANVAAYVPTDCPTREKHGWLGDAVTTAEEAMLNFDMASVYTYYLDTILDSQRPDGDEPPAVPIKDFPGRPDFPGPAISARPASSDISWTVAYPLITRWMLKFYGDSRVVKKHYAALKRYTDGLLARAAQSSILPIDFRYGDWCAIEARAVATAATGPPMAGFNYILAIDAMGEMALAVGNATDAVRYIALGASLRKLYWPMFYNKTLRAFGTHELDLQTSTVAPLALGGVIPAASKSDVVASLHADVMTTQRGHLTVGSIGAKHLLPQLSKHGLHDDAMTVATQTTYPSFGFWLANGATTCWENYSGEADQSHPPTPTRNHIFLCGGIGEWMYRQAVGVGPTGDGYSRVAIAPMLSSLDGTAASTAPTRATATLRTVAGRIDVSWERSASGSALSVNATLPIAVHGAAITVPLTPLVAGADTITEGGVVVWADGAYVAGREGIVSGAASTLGHGGVTFEVRSGDYAFVARAKHVKREGAGSPTSSISIKNAVPAVSTSAAAASTMDLHLLPKDQPGGNCLDGSPAGYYISSNAGTASIDAKTWVISMAGGGACYTEQSCKTRAKSDKGSSTNWPKENPYRVCKQEPLYCNDCATNPLFCNATQVHVPYCTGDCHRGNRTTADAGSFGFYFQGHSSFVNMIAELKSQHGLGDATHVVLTGSSAGGWGVFSNIDWLQSALPNAVVKGAPMAGWFHPGSLPSDQPSLPDDPPSDFAHWSKNKSGGAGNEASAEFAALWQPIIDPACAAGQTAKKANPLDCQSVHVHYKYIKAPIFVIENQYDTAQLFGTEGLPKHGPYDATWRSYVAFFGASMRASTNQVLTLPEKKGDGLFHPSCFQHPIQDNETIGGGTGWVPIFSDWFWGLGKLTAKYKQVETCDASFKGLPCNPYVLPPGAPGVPEGGSCRVPGASPPGPPGPAPSGNCSAQLVKDGCSASAGQEACDACAGKHQSNLRRAGCTSEQVQQLCAAGGPTPPPPGPPGGGCSTQLAKDGCSATAGQEACEACGEKHEADLKAAGCTPKLVQQLCAGGGPAPPPPAGNCTAAEKQFCPGLAGGWAQKGGPGGAQKGGPPCYACVVKYEDQLMAAGCFTGTGSGKRHGFIETFCG